MKRNKLFNNKDNEADFCESYKSQILGSNKREKEESFFSTLVKLLTILILLVVIIGVSFYGYNYFMNSQKLNETTLPPISMQISDDDLVVEMEELETELVVIEKEDLIKEEVIAKKVDVIKKEVIEKTVENISLPLVVAAQVEESDMEKMANDIKIAIAKSELKEENETKIEKVETISENIQIIEEVNDTEEVESLEVPSSSAPEAQYLEELADLSKEIDKERNP